jgi:hypothetical protein
MESHPNALGPIPGNGARVLSARTGGRHTTILYIPWGRAPLMGAPMQCGAPGCLFPLPWLSAKKLAPSAVNA